MSSVESLMSANSTVTCLRSPSRVLCAERIFSTRCGGVYVSGARSCSLAGAVAASPVQTSTAPSSSVASRLAWMISAFTSSRYSSSRSNRRLSARYDTRPSRRSNSHTCASTSSNVTPLPPWLPALDASSAVHGDTILYHTLQRFADLRIFLFCVYVGFQAPEVERAPDERIGIAAHRSGIDHQQIDVASDRLSAPGIRAKEHHANEWQYLAQSGHALTQPHQECLTAPGWVEDLHRTGRYLRHTRPAFPLLHGCSDAVESQTDARQDSDWGCRPYRAPVPHPVCLLEPPGAAPAHPANPLQSGPRRPPLFSGRAP